MKNAHKRPAKWSIVRHVVQCLFIALFFLPLVVSAHDGAVLFFGSRSSTTVFGLSLLDPFAALQTIVAAKSFPLSLLAGAAPLLIFYALVRGRAFCGWFCPVGFLVEITSWIRTRLGIKDADWHLNRHAKIIVAGIILLLSALVSVPVFEIFTPVSALNKLILFGAAGGLWTLVAVIVLELFAGGRIWCRSLCPLGGFYESIGRTGFISVKIDQNACTHCDNCKDVCLADPAILNASIDGTASHVIAGDCMLCGKCIDACPTEALAFKVIVPRALGGHK